MWAGLQHVVPSTLRSTHSRLLHTLLLTIEAHVDLASPAILHFRHQPDRSDESGSVSLPVGPSLGQTPSPTSP